MLQACLQLAANSICHRVDVFEHLVLLFQLATHVVGLHTQVAHCAENAIKGLVLIVHNLHLLLLFKLSIIVLVIIKRIRIRQRTALLLGIMYRLLQRLVHVLNFVAHFSHQSSAALHLVDLEPEFVRVMFDSFDALHQVLKILAEVLEGLFKLLPGFSELWAIC